MRFEEVRCKNFEHLGHLRECVEVLDEIEVDNICLVAEVRQIEQAFRSEIVEILVILLAALDGLIEEVSETVSKHQQQVSVAEVQLVS